MIERMTAKIGFGRLSNQSNLDGDNTTTTLKEVPKLIWILPEKPDSLVAKTNSVV